MGAVVAAFDFAFMGGSMGTAVGEGILAAARLAVLQQAPLIVIPASGGARMQEGILSLMQMPRTTIAVRSEEHTSELQSLMRISYAVFCLKKKKSNTPTTNNSATTI